MTEYYRPILHVHGRKPDAANSIGWCWFDRVVVYRRDADVEIVAADSIPTGALARLIAPRPPIAGLTMDSPRVMGILNVTPDSFSDGGRFDAPDMAQAHALTMIAEGADILDIGGESTRPGAKPVDIEKEISRTAPVIAAIRAASHVPISIDTRKADVAAAALGSGANLVNDVSAMTYDPAIGAIAARAQAPICLMHAQGDPETMQQDPQYENVLLDVYDFLQERIAVAVAAGIAQDRIVVDPGIGFGKTLDHNLALLRGISLFHSLGCPILLGASRKRFIGTLGAAPIAEDRLGGSVAVALHGAAQGVQFLRVHDTMATRQALSLQMAIAGQVTHDT